MTHDGRICKGDFDIRFLIGPGQEQQEDDLKVSVAALVVSYVNPKLTVEIFQPAAGDLHRTILQICLNGLAGAEVETMMIGQKGIKNPDRKGQIGLFYKGGKVIEHSVHMCADPEEEDCPAVHMLTIEFADVRLETNVFNTESEAKRRAFTLVENCGSELSKTGTC